MKSSSLYTESGVYTLQHIVDWTKVDSGRSLDARSHLHRYNYENPIESRDLLKELNQVIQKSSFPHGRKFMSGTWHRSCRWGEVPCRGQWVIKGLFATVCYSCSSISLSLNSHSPQRWIVDRGVREDELFCSGAHVLRRTGPSLTIFRIIRRNPWLPSKINLITLSYALRPIAKLCLSVRPDRIFFLYSQFVLLGRTRAR